MRNASSTPAATQEQQCDLTLTGSLHSATEADELQAMLREEREYVGKRKAAVGDTGPETVGLALSGGGIRSATFCFGVLQVLQSQGLMRRVDYMSTVSGGGYTGSAYSAWRLRQAMTSPPIAATPGEATQPAHTDFLEARKQDAIYIRAEPPEQWEQLLPHLRKFSNYLSPTLGIGTPGTWRIIGTMARNLVLHWLALTAAIVLVLSVLLLSFRFLWLVSVTAAFAGLAIVARAGWKERAGRAFVRDCQRAAPTRPPAECASLARQVQELLQSPRLSMFSGLTLYAFGAAIGFVASTYPQFPDVGFAVFMQGLMPAALAEYLGTRFWSAAVLMAVSIGLVLAVGFVSEWRWRPRRRFFPKWQTVGFLLLAAVPATWFVLASYNDGLIPLAQNETLSLLDALLRPATWSLSAAWTYAWQTGVTLLLLVFVTSVIIAVYANDMDREEREWSTRVISACLVAALAWIALAGLTIASAQVAVMVFAGAMTDTQQLSGAGLTGVWLAVSAWAARLGKTEAFKSLAGKQGKRLLVAVGPWVFLAGLIFVTCFGAIWVLLTLGNIFVPTELALNSTQTAAAILWSDVYVAAMFGVALPVFVAVGAILDPNEYSLHGFYRDRLVRGYLGASNADTPAPDSIWNIRTDDLPLCDTLNAVVAKGVGAPFHIVNTAVNLFGSKDLRVQQRHCDSFVLTPLRCGSWATNYGKTPSRLYLGSALAISGAAVSSNAGLATQGAAIAALMTFFNMRLGYWFGNPRFGALETSKRPTFAPKYLFAEALSLTNEDRPFVNLSDGGHFDNLGLYELIRRRCRYIVVVDAECDPNYEFSSLAQAIRMVRIDFNVNIEIDVQKLAPVSGERFARGHWALGKIIYRDASKPATSFPDRGLSDAGPDVGELLYIKSSLLAEGRNAHISADVIEFSRRYDRFPHDTTADQFFTEQQFESYRKLGECIALHVFRNAGDSMPAVFAHLGGAGIAQGSTTPTG